METTTRAKMVSWCPSSHVKVGILRTEHNLVCLVYGSVGQMWMVGKVSIIRVIRKQAELGVDYSPVAITAVLV